MAAWQAWLLHRRAAGALAAWLFLLKVRPPRIDVPSLLLWRRVLDEARELTWWERVRRAVSLVATVARRARAGAGRRRGPAPRVDGRRRAAGCSSCSTRRGRCWRGRSDGETRWERAVAEARRAGRVGRRRRRRARDDGRRPRRGPDDRHGADRDARSIGWRPSGGEDAPWPRVAGADAVHFITDGARRAAARRRRSIVHSVFEAGGERRRSPRSTSGRRRRRRRRGRGLPRGRQLRADAAGGAHHAHARHGDRCSTAASTWRAGEAVRQVVPLAADRRRAPARARRAPSRTRSTIDDEAVAWIAGAEPLAVTVVSEQPAPLGAAAAARSGRARRRSSTPAAYRPGRDDVVIFDRWLPADAPARPALCLAPPAAAWLGDAPAPTNSAPRWIARRRRIRCSPAWIR